ncbi:MAG: hypothetical protein JSV73_07280 [Flavobacteriaceae bacterium]|nr:MAG: hypothetical protein JSV73_07280 [Flavobacteriaceae bacterium]
MIKEILIGIEQEARDRVYREQKSLVAIKAVIDLVNQIDHEVEEVPLQDRNRLSRLLVSLKGSDLNEEENRLIEKIITN